MPEFIQIQVLKVSGFFSQNWTTHMLKYAHHLRLRLLVILSIVSMVYCETAASENSEQLSDQAIDQQVEDYLERMKWCPNATESFGWICGATVQLPGPHFSRVCTSKDEPFFSGSISLPEERGVIGHGFSLLFEMPLEPLLPCKAEESFLNPSTCASISVVPSTEAAYGVFGEKPPTNLPAELPNPPFKHRWHTHEPTAFSELDGEPVAFFYTSWLAIKSDRPPDACRLKTRIDDKRIGIGLTIPCSNMDEWRSHLRAAVKAVIQGIVHEDENASCKVLPPNAVILISRSQSWKIERLKKWLKLHR